MPFRGYSLLSLFLWLDVRKERALTVPSLSTRLYPVCGPCPYILLRAVPAPLGHHGGWVDLRLLWRQ